MEIKRLLSATHVDYWYGDWVRLLDRPERFNFLVKIFHSCHDSVYVRGYLTVLDTSNTSTGIEMMETDLPVTVLACKMPSRLDVRSCVLALPQHRSIP